MVDKRVEISGRKEKFFERQDEIRHGQDGWLTPRGKFYPCEPDEHDKSAEFLLSEGSSEKEDLSKIHKSSLYILKQDLPAREKLKKSGYVLVRGEVLPSQELGNLTTSQLRTLEGAGIQILDPMENIKFSPEIALKAVDLLRERTGEIKNLEEYREKVGVVEDFLDQKSKTDKKLEPGLLDILFDEFPTLPFDVSFGLTSIESLGRFEESPLTENIRADESYVKGYDEFINSVFSILSNGYIEGVKISMKQRVFHLRLLPTKKEGFYLVIEKSEYRHDGLTGGMTGDVNYTVTARLANERGLTERVGNIKESSRESGGPEIEFEGEHKVLDRKHILDVE